MLLLKTNDLLRSIEKELRPGKEAPQSKMEEVEKVFIEDWGKPLKEYFEEFEVNPIGSASLAQVHKAKTKSGKVVAVKIQHHSLDTFSDIDIRTVAFVVKAIKFFFPTFKFDWLAQEMKTNLPKEMDFVHEGRNSERAARLFKNNPYLVVPQVVWPLTSRRILTMEFSPGHKITDLDYIQSNNFNKDQIADQVSHIFSQMIFVNGFVHSDPHPGNIFVRPLNGKKDGRFQIVLLDHGLYREVERDIRLNYAKLWYSIIQKDEKGIQYYSSKLGVGHLYQLFSCMLTARIW